MVRQSACVALMQHAMAAEARPGPEHAALEAPARELGDQVSPRTGPSHVTPQPSFLAKMIFAVTYAFAVGCDPKRSPQSGIDLADDVDDNSCFIPRA